MLGKVHVFLFIAGRDHRRTLICSDSIFAGAAEFIKRAKVVVMPGARLHQIGDHVLHEEFDIQQFNLTIVHAGTNDIHRKSVEEIVDTFKRQVKRFRRLHPKGWLGYSCIIPRPCDSENINNKVAEVNRSILEWGSKHQIVVLKTYAPFTFGGKVVLEFYKKDLLHPGLHSSSAKGVSGARRLADFINQQLSDSVLLPRIRQLSK